MVAIHAALAGVDPPRVTDDGDVVVDVRTFGRRAMRKVADSLVAAGFTASASLEGVTRFVRGQTKIDHQREMVASLGPPRTGEHLHAHHAINPALRHEAEVDVPRLDRFELVTVGRVSLAPVVDAMIVVGSPNSSNSQRLREVAEHEGCPRAVLVNGAADLDWSMFEGITRLGITAGASAPEVLVEEILDAFAEKYTLRVDSVSAASEDGIFFPLPRPLRPSAAAE